MLGADSDWSGGAEEASGAAFIGLGEAPTKRHGRRIDSEMKSSDNRKLRVLAKCPIRKPWQDHGQRGDERRSLEELKNQRVSDSPTKGKQKLSSILELPWLIVTPPWDFL